ncbi:hypothetical protein GCM10007424_00280 [Flavobacterium suaedae]|uniref:ATPase dynein-related AAA domain-containing protein n=2 Tax=Flavobacterium suaedae TaxID=1767027 RepID=A0ABQ1JB32_9FLAO|nr:hypothetical protein GCM10007424_00280 [Flavobacterium suaedae]
MHPDERLSEQTIIEILRKKKIIGMGSSWNNKHGNPVDDPRHFKDSVAIGDIVMVRDGTNPVALVRVVGKSYIDNNINPKFDWFDLRREIEILGLFESEDKILLDNILNKYNSNHIQAPGTLTFCNNDNATNHFIVKWHRAIQYRNLMNNIKLSTTRKDQIKALWDNFKAGITPEQRTLYQDGINKTLGDWELYKQKVTNGTLSLDEYTNVLKNTSATLPGGYLCNFLERTTSSVLGSSKPGNAENFGVKLNADGTYYVKKQSANASKIDAEQFFNKNIKEILNKIVLEKDPIKKAELVDSSSYSAKQILMKMAVLDNLSDFLFIYSGDVIGKLYEDFIDGTTETTFSRSHELCKVLLSILDIDPTDTLELVLLSRFIWKYTKAQAIADSNSPNVILYGPPGTGKTYSVLNDIEFVCLGDTTRYELLQFHPSFTYEDFIEGVKPKGVTKDGTIRFELVNGIFKNFCIKAKLNPDKEYYFIVDEINRANLSAVFGETLSLMEKGYRHETGSNKNLIRTQYSSLVDSLIAEDINNFGHLAYEIDNGISKFGIPSNLYFIGMMNDVDKSIDTFDLALRRRFKWLRKDCDYDVLDEETLFNGKDNFENIADYILSCRNLNNYISSDLGLGRSFEFGHAFFMKIGDIAKKKNITPGNKDVLFNLYLRPTLREYLRSVYPENEIDEKLQYALNLFRA